MSARQHAAVPWQIGPWQTPTDASKLAHRPAGPPTTHPHPPSGGHDITRDQVASDPQGQPASQPTAPHGRLGIVIPLANEAETVTPFLKDVAGHCGPNDLIVCVLDEVSRDTTLEKVRSAAERDPRIQPIWAPQNRSVVDAYFCGYRAALEANCDWILEMDGGFSHLPAEIPRFTSRMDGTHDFLAGSRFTPGGSYIGRGQRYLVSRAGTLLARRVLDVPMRDLTSGFEAFSRDALTAVVERGVRSRAHFFQTEIRYLLSQWRWTEVPITYRDPSGTVGGGSVREALTNLNVLRHDTPLPAPVHSP